MCGCEHGETCDRCAEDGLYGKYIVTKSDGSPVDPKADYFVLRLDTDKTARHAARTYARNIQSTMPGLADGIRERCDRHALRDMAEEWDDE